MISRIKEKIQNQIQYATSWNMSPEEISYLSGLADALEIIEQAEADSLKVGTEYYVLSWNQYQNTTIIEKRKLTKITTTESRTAYTFSTGKHDMNPVTLYGKGGLASRVFNSIEAAKCGMQHVYLDQKRQY